MWEGLEDEESTWEPVSRVFADALTVLRKELQKMKLGKYIRRALQTRYPGLRV